MRPRHPHNHAKSLQFQHYAAQNRAVPTASEARLWSALSAGKLGVQFRRQVVLGNSFIVDFVAPRVRLVKEVDGGYHAQRAAVDARRDSKLHRLGYRVLQIPAALVMNDLRAALELVRSALQGRPAAPSAKLPFARYTDPSLT